MLKFRSHHNKNKMLCFDLYINPVYLFRLLRNGISLHTIDAIHPRVITV